MASLHARNAARAALVSLSVLAGAGTAHAQGGDGAAALSLFEEGKRLAAEGDFQQACPKLLASYGLIQKLGTLLNLADCYERSGRTASAWVRFTEATTIADRAGQQERTEFARSHAAALLPRLARVTISVDRPADEGLVVRRDGAIVDAAAFGTPVPVDPGTHSVEASAPHRRTWTSSIVIERDAPGDHAVAIPALEPEAAAEVIAPAQATPAIGPEAPPLPPVHSTQRTWAYVAGGVGVAGIAASLVAGALANGQYARSNDAGGCVNDRCTARGLDDRSSASTTASVATAFFVGGALLLGTGIVLYLTSPSPPALARTAW